MKMNNLLAHAFFGYFAPLNAVARAMRKRRNPVRQYLAIMRILDKKYSTMHQTG